MCSSKRSRAPAVELLDGEPPAVVHHRLPHVGDVLERAKDEPADGVPVLVGHVQVEQLVDVLDGRAAVDEIVAVGEPLNADVLDVVSPILVG